MYSSTCNNKLHITLVIWFLYIKNAVFYVDCILIKPLCDYLFIIQRHHSTELLDHRLSKKYSSCSTIFIDDSTVSQPNLKNTIKAVALAIYFHIRNRDHREDHQLEGRLLDIFDERLHPLTVSQMSVLFQVNMSYCKSNVFLIFHYHEKLETQKY